jgi:uncharacterized protein (DUF2062 family)
LVRPILHLLTQGITPEKIALSLAFGIMLGVFPVMGTTTVLCLIAALLFRLNLAVVQLVNFRVCPLWFALLIPFTRVGERLFGAPPLALTGSQMLTLAHANFLHSISVLWLTALRAAAAWMLVGPPGIIVLYVLLVPVFRRMARLHLASARAGQDSEVLSERGRRLFVVSRWQKPLPQRLPTNNQRLFFPAKFSPIAYDESIALLFVGAEWLRRNRRTALKFWKRESGWILSIMYFRKVDRSVQAGCCNSWRCMRAAPPG